ncbi:hypothetical protein BJ508DRAFT_346745 [Ascobolus immersus RN42]|uniref:CBM-cenC domain-containing protein n=1 Tax=Ascobolus immersus RN42 TaxID=1160509 RepID=A0A3N4I5U4_ASCIM|nr:hypothetical protein BJ508DRAFT_346745 [Ascobolus immersus RN42]
MHAILSLAALLFCFLVSVTTKPLINLPRELEGASHCAPKTVYCTVTEIIERRLISKTTKTEWKVSTKTSFRTTTRYKTSTTTKTQLKPTQIASKTTTSVRTLFATITPRTCATTTITLPRQTLSTTRTATDRETQMLTTRLTTTVRESQVTPTRPTPPPTTTGASLTSTRITSTRVGSPTTTSAPTSISVSTTVSTSISTPSTTLSSTSSSTSTTTSVAPLCTIPAIANGNFESDSASPWIHTLNEGHLNEATSGLLTLYNHSPNGKKSWLFEYTTPTVSAALSQPAKFCPVEYRTRYRASLWMRKASNPNGYECVVFVKVNGAEIGRTRASIETIFWTMVGPFEFTLGEDGVGADEEGELEIGVLCEGTLATSRMLALDDVVIEPVLAD